MRTLLKLGLLLAAYALAANAQAHEVRHGKLVIAHPFVAADKNCPNAPTRGYLMMVINEADHPDKLLGAQLDSGAVGRITRYAAQAGKTTAIGVSELEIPAKSNVALIAPNLAIEFPHQDKLVEGGMVPGALRFERAGEIAVKFMVEATHRSAGGNKPTCDDTAASNKN